MMGMVVAERQASIDRVMEICKNRRTGNVFIYLYAEDAHRAIMITPQGMVKALETSLFSEPVAVDDADRLVDQGKINRRQYRVYREFSDA